MVFFIAAIEFSKLGLVQDLAAVMLMAGFAAALFHYFGWPKVIGYISAGALIAASDSVRSFLISNEDSVKVLANLGVIFLMFTLGLELNIRKLRSAGNIIFPTAIFDMLAMLVAGYVLGRYGFGLGMLPSLFLGAMVCDSSTTLLAKSLDEMGCSKENFASIIFGITISEDVMTIGVMAVLTGLSLTGQFQAAELFHKLFALFIFLTSVMVFGLMLLPKYLDRLKKMKDEETLLIMILGICFGISFIAEKLQYSLALGAFLVGAVVARSSVSKRIHENTESLRNMFSAMFFVSIGLMVRPMELLDNIVPILVLTMFVFIGKTFNCCVMSYLMGQPHKDAFKTGVGLAQIGDFSYMIALMGLTLNNGEAPYPRMYQIAVGTSVLTTLINPFLLKKTIPLGLYLDKKMPGSILRMLENYTSYVRNAGKQIKKDSNWAQIRKNFIFYLINLALLISVFLAAHFINNQPAFWNLFPHLVSRYHSILAWLSTSFISFFIMISAFLYARKMAGYLSMAMTQALPKTSVNESLRQFLRLCIVVVSIVFMLFIFTSLSMLLLADIWVVICIFVIYAVFCLTKWKKVKQVAESGQETLLQVLEQEKFASDTDMLAEGRDSRRIRIDSKSGAIGYSLAQLHLRNRTGATIAQVRRRHGEIIRNPKATLLIEQGDELELLANDEQYQAAQELLSSEKIEFTGMDTISGFLELRVESICLSEKAYALGRTLAELRIRNMSGTTVVRIDRVDGTKIDNPGPDAILAYADHVFLLGTLTQIEAGFQYLENGPLISR